MKADTAHESREWPAPRPAALVSPRGDVYTPHSEVPL